MEFLFYIKNVAKLNPYFFVNLDIAMIIYP